MFTLSRIPVNNEDKDPKQEMAIYIMTNGVHTDVVVPLKNDIANWSSKTKISHTTSNDSLMKWVGFGWGDKGFYLNTPQWSDLKVSTAFDAAFYRGTGVLHVTFFRTLQESESCRKIMISNAEYQKLVGFIDSNFILDESGNPILLPDAAYGDHDSFYEATGKYNLFYTCNSWANNALKAADQKAALWTLTDTGIFLHYK
jgi:uncharacterized protein (TIGR02117 family)